MKFLKTFWRLKSSTHRVNHRYTLKAVGLLVHTSTVFFAHMVVLMIAVLDLNGVDQLENNTF